MRCVNVQSLTGTGNLSESQVLARRESSGGGWVIAARSMVCSHSRVAVAVAELCSAVLCCVKLPSGEWRPASGGGDLEDCCCCRQKEKELRSDSNIRHADIFLMRGWDGTP